MKKVSRNLKSDHNSPGLYNFLYNIFKLQKIRLKMMEETEETEEMEEMEMGMEMEMEGMTNLKRKKN